MDDSVFGIAMPFSVKFLLHIRLRTSRVVRVPRGRCVDSAPASLAAGARAGASIGFRCLEWAKVDNRRFLCLVRRDNVEHLLIIGGPTDVVVEANIVRAVAASRDVALARPGRRRIFVARHSVAG